MNIWEAIFLGIIQGLTEFLPISSTGHLTLAGKLLHLIPDRHPEEWTAFIAVIQLGTVLAVIIYFRKDILEIIFDFIKQNLKQRVKFKDQNLNSRLGWLIIIGTIPVGVAGISLKKIIEGTLTKDLYVIASSLIGLAFLLAIAERLASLKKDMNKITKWDSFWVGVAQCFALIPGSSRSGTTITGGLFLGMNRETAARFSFLLSIPAVLASGLLELFEARKFLDSSMSFHMIASTVFAFIFGYISIDMLLKYLRRNTTYVFVYYRVALGVLILVLLYSHVILP